MRPFSSVPAGWLLVGLIAASTAAIYAHASRAEDRPAAQELAAQVVAAVRENWRRLPSLEMSAVNSHRTKDVPEYIVRVRAIRGDASVAHYGPMRSRQTHRLGPEGAHRCDVFDEHGRWIRSYRVWQGKRYEFDESGPMERSIDGSVSSPVCDPRQAGARSISQALDAMLAPEHCVAASWRSVATKNDILQLRYEPPAAPPFIVQCAVKWDLLPVRVEWLSADGSPLVLAAMTYQPVKSGWIVKSWTQRRYDEDGYLPDDSGWSVSSESEFSILKENPAYDEETFAASWQANEEVAGGSRAIRTGVKTGGVQIAIADRSAAPASRRLGKRSTPGWFGIGMALLASAAILIAWRNRRRRVAALASSGEALAPLRPWRFGMRTFLLAFTALAIGLGLMARQAHETRRLVDTVDDCGGKAWYWHQVDSEGNLIGSPAPPGPDWLRQWIGVEYFDSVAAIDLESAMLTNELFDRLADADDLVRLSLPGTSVDDVRVARLSGLDQLKHLDLSESSITDKGLATLGALTSLKSLRLFHCQITSEGVGALSHLPIEFLGLSASGPDEPHGDVLDRFGELKQVIFSQELSRTMSDAGEFTIPVDFNRIDVAVQSMPLRRPRRGAMERVEPALLAKIASLEPDASADDVWARAIALDLLGRDEACRDKSAELFRTAIERSTRPAPIWVSFGLSLPPQSAIDVARKTVEANLARHPHQGLLRQLLGTAEPNVACFAAALALEPEKRDAWYATALALRGRRRREALDAWGASDPENGAPHYLKACLAMWSLDEKGLEQSLKQGNERAGVQIPAIPWPDADSVEDLRQQLESANDFDRDEISDPHALLTHFESSFADWQHRELIGMSRGDAATLNRIEAELPAIAAPHVEGLRQAALRLAKTRRAGPGLYHFWLRMSESFVYARAAGLDHAALERNPQARPRNLEVATGTLSSVSEELEMPNGEHFVSHPLFGPVVERGYFAQRSYSAEESFSSEIEALLRDKGK